MELKDLTAVVVTILLVGMLLGLGIYVLMEFRSSVATDQTGSDVNQPANTTAGYNTVTLSDSTKTHYSLSGITVVNASNGASFTNVTYTSGGVVTFGSDITAQNTLVNITSTYIYDVPGSTEAAVGTTVTGVSDFADWIAVIVVVIAAAIVLGIVLRSFGGSRGV